MNDDTMTPAMALALAASFGSAARWRDDFVKRGKDQGGVVLAFDANEGTLVNQPLAGAAVPLLEMRGDPAGPVDWAAVYERYQQAVYAASEPFGAGHDDVAGALLLDVRRAGVYQQATTMLPGARWCDPARVAEWRGDLPTDRALIVYCVYGHEVGRSTALRLRAVGLAARYLRGGIDGWQAANQALVPKVPPMMH